MRERGRGKPKWKNRKGVSLLWTGREEGQRKRSEWREKNEERILKREGEEEGQEAQVKGKKINQRRKCRKGERKGWG